LLLAAAVVLYINLNVQSLLQEHALVIQFVTLKLYCERASFQQLLT
jgi:hypothetical protein